MSCLAFPYICVVGSMLETHSDLYNIIMRFLTTVENHIHTIGGCRKIFKAVNRFFLSALSDRFLSTDMGFVYCQIISLG